MNQMLGRLEDSRDRQRQFVADASHELRSPLASIRQPPRSRRAHPGALPEGELADAVLEESARMQRLVEQLLLLTRADEGAVVRRPHDVDLDDLALAEARRVRAPGSRRHDPVSAPAGSAATTLRSRRCVRNLVDNAARHAEVADGARRRRDGDGVELVVEDDGPGHPRRTSASGSSSGSCGSTRPAPATPAAAGSGWRS